jgi:hypothetical protein
MPPTSDLCSKTSIFENFFSATRYLGSCQLPRSFVSVAHRDRHLDALGGGKTARSGTDDGDAVYVELFVHHGGHFCNGVGRLSRSLLSGKDLLRRLLSRQDILGLLDVGADKKDPLPLPTSRDI